MTFLHAQRFERLGELLGIPVSRVLAPVDDATEMRAGPTDLILGEGSGGLPAAVVPIALAVTTYLSHLEDILAGESGPTPDPSLVRGVTEQRVEAATADALRLDGYAEHTLVNFDQVFARWGGDMWAELVSAARHSRVGAAYCPATHHSIEAYLVAALGEFALVTGVYERRVAHPDVTDIRTAAALLGVYRAVSLVPPGYPH